MIRPHDLNFNHCEKLWRRISTDHVRKDGSLKPNMLKLQVSVVREKYSKIENVTFDKFNGVAEILFEEAFVCCNNCEFVVVDDPNEENPGHALIAALARPSNKISELDFMEIKTKLTLAFKVVKSPFKK